MRKFIRPYSANMLSSLPGRVVLVVFSVVVTAAVFSLIFVVNVTILDFVLKYTLVAALGMISGASSRRMLAANTGLLRFLTAVAALLAGLAVLQPLTYGFAGLHIVRHNPNQPDWDGLTQFGLGLLIAWLPLLAWPPSVPAGRVVAPQKPKPAAKPRRGRASQSAKPRPSLQANFRAAVTAPKRWALSVLPSPGVKLNKPSMVKPRRKKPRWKARRNANIQVQLVGAEEHNCPFCLELVDKTDPRGVKVCPTCNTHHHADCWAITGTCQVPHEYV